MDNAITVLSGGTGNLGGRIARAILDRGANMRAIVRHNSDPDKVGKGVKSALSFYRSIRLTYIT